jgi:hypothetical protein
MAEEEIKEENEEEKFNIISEILKELKKKKNYRDVQQELIKQIKDDYINSLFYDFTKNIIKKLIDSDVENIEIIKQKLNTVAYDSILRKYTALFSEIADLTSVAYDDNYLRINFNIIVKNIPVLFANIEIFQHDYKITIFEDQDITKITKRDLLLSLLKLTNHIISIDEDDDYEDDED